MKKNRIWLYVLLGTLSFTIGNYACADSISSDETAYINNKLSSAAAESATRIICTTKLKCNISATTQFYLAESGVPVWTKNGKILPMADDMLSILKNSYQSGLNPPDYHINELVLLYDKISSSQTDTPEYVALLGDFDVTLSDAFLLYAKHMAFGRLDTRTAYPNWLITKRSVDTQGVLARVAKDQSIAEGLKSITPQYSGYENLRLKLNDYQKIAENGGWGILPANITLKLGSKGKNVVILQRHLVLTGQLEDLNSKKIFDKNTRLAVIKYQQENNLPLTGVVDKKTLTALNITVQDRIKQIELNLDRLRWLPQYMGWRYVLVNIPDFSLTVVKDNEDIMHMPVIVGKGTNRSCILSSRITYLELNPYWNIPDSIAKKETLPKLKEDPGYLNKEHIKVFPNYDPGAAEIDSSKINWKKIEASSLSYKFRQDPGDQNSLGRVKFIFPNDCGIYLHDTPTRNLFGRNRRDLSHGCIRIGKPLELADYLLQDKPGWDSTRIDNQIKSGKRQVVTLVQPIDVHILYATTWVDESGNLQFRNDIYKIDDVDYPVYLPKQNDESN